GGLAVHLATVPGDPDRVDPSACPDGQVVCPGVESGHGQEVEGSGVAAGALGVVPCVQSEPVPLGAFDDDVVVGVGPPGQECLVGGLQVHPGLGEWGDGVGVVLDALGGAHDAVGSGCADTLGGGPESLVHVCVLLGAHVLVGQQRGFAGHVD